MPRDELLYIIIINIILLLSYTMKLLIIVENETNAFDFTSANNKT